MGETQNDQKHLEKIVREIQFAMFTTFSEEDGSLRSRPMTLQDRVFDGDFWFFAGKSSPLAADIAQNPRVNLAFANQKDSSYVSVSGTAELVRDPEKIHELWNAGVRAWFPEGESDPDVALVRVQVENADYWEAGAAKAVQLYAIAKAYLTGQRPGPGVGHHGHLEM